MYVSQTRTPAHTPLATLPPLIRLVAVSDVPEGYG